MSDLTADERDQMAHCIGHASAKGCSVHGWRNHYCTDATDPIWCGLVDRGLAVVHRSPILPGGEATFILTPAGIAALEDDPRSQPPKSRGRSWEVRFRQFDSPSYVWAESRGKAKYAAIRDIADCFPDGVGEAFKSITSCRLA